MSDSTKNGSWVGIVIFILLGILAYNHFTTQKIQDDYGYQVQTSGITDKPDCSSLEPNNPYDYDSGHYAGFEWGASGNSCTGDSESFIEGCQEYQNEEDAYNYCLSRNQ